MSKTWIELSKSALLNNFNQFRNLVGQTKILAVLKSNAYGHGLEEVSQILSKTDVNFFGVDNTAEALLLSKMKLRPSILVLGYTPLEEIRELIENDISFTVYDLIHLKKIVELNLGKPAKVHLKIDTGMHRQGVFKEEVEVLINYILENNSKIILEGVSTHYADVKNPPDFDFTEKQLNYFMKVKEEIKKLYPEKVMFHTAATASTLLYRDTYMDMVRVGIGLYGYWPAEEVRNFLKDKNIELTPVLSWKSLVAQVKEIEPGETVSYSRTWMAEKKTKIAIIPVGYYDGFDRGLSNKGEVLIVGKKAKVLGRVCMNMIMVDVTQNEEVRQADVVVVIGDSEGKTITAGDIASTIGTISYEVLARLNPKIEKRIVE